MNLIKKSLFFLGHEAAERGFYANYKNLINNQWKSYDELRNNQEKQLRLIIKYSYEHIPYYKRLFDNLSIHPEEIKLNSDLKILPVLTKEIINNNWNDFIPDNLERQKYYTVSTGGTTGTPLKYRISKYHRFLTGVLLYRGWGYCGYRLSDKMVFLGGASIDVGTNSGFITRIHEIGRNIKKLSSFDMGDSEMMQYINVINRFKPKYIRGYASSIYFLSQWIQERNVRVHLPDACFTTSEKLYPEMRKLIGQVFHCEVYDAYGLNDGGLSAFECPAHSGMHVDTEKGIMEVVDDEGNQLENGEGRILATSLYNYAMPFIRYDTGDIGTISDKRCSCGREYRLLKDIVGRSVDMLITPEGKNVHGWFFLYIFWQYCKGIKEYQVEQISKEVINIKIVPEDNFEESQLDIIRRIVREKSEAWVLNFEFVDNIQRTAAGKFKFIINKIGKDKKD